MTGVLLMFGASVAFSIMAGLIKATPTISPAKMVLFRFIIGFALLGLAAIFNRITLKFTRSPLLFLRGVFGGTAVFIFYLSIRHIGVGKGTVFTYTFPIFASIFSALFLKEKIKGIKWLFITLAFAGIYMLATGGIGESFLLLSIGFFELLALGGAVLAGTAVVLIKKLHKSEDSYAIFFAQCLFGFWIFVIPANISPSIGGYNEGIILVGVGLVAAIGQLLMTEGYRHVSVTTGSLLNMLVPVFNVVVALTLFNEPMTIVEIIGSIIVIGSCILMISSDGLFGKVAKHN